MKDPRGADFGWSVDNDLPEGNWSVVPHGDGQSLEAAEPLQQPLEELLHRGDPLTTAELLSPVRAIDRLDRGTDRPPSVEARLRALCVPEVPFEIDRRNDREFGEGRRRFPGV